MKVRVSQLVVMGRVRSWVMDYVYVDLTKLQTCVCLCVCACACACMCVLLYLDLELM